MTLAQVHLMFSYCPWTTEKALPRAHRDTPKGEQVGSVAPCRGSHGRLSERVSERTCHRRSWDPLGDENGSKAAGLVLGGGRRELGESLPG